MRLLHTYVPLYFRRENISVHEILRDVVYTVLESYGYMNCYENVWRKYVVHSS